MEMYIRIKNGKPFEHPILGDNFRQAFPDVDINNLPPEFATFAYIPPPELAVYEVCDECTYEWDGGIVTSVYHVRAMTEEEKTNMQDAVKLAHAENTNGYASWVFNEETCSFEAPVAYPQDGNGYRWDEETTSWVEIDNA